MASPPLLVVDLLYHTLSSAGEVGYTAPPETGAKLGGLTIPDEYGILTKWINIVNNSPYHASFWQEAKMEAKLPEPKYETECPSVCPKRDCRGTVFLPHEDGWQCFNCMKIIYKAQSKESEVPVKRYSHYRGN